MTVPVVRQLHDVYDECHDRNRRQVLEMNRNLTERPDARAAMFQGLFYVPQPLVSIPEAEFTPIVPGLPTPREAPSRPRTIS